MRILLLESRLQNCLLSLTLLGLGPSEAIGLTQGTAGPGLLPDGPVKAVEIGGRRELFVDDYLIERMRGCELRLHHPVPRETAIVHDQPWEGNRCTYCTVFKDGDLYRMYYLGMDYAFGDSVRPSHEPVTCYAESNDGIRWRKPELGLCPYKGKGKTNIVFFRSEKFPQELHEDSFLVVFKDQNPACAANARYKALRAGTYRGRRCLFAFRSGDGIHWTAMEKNPLPIEGRFDSQNLAFWDATRQEYRIYFRTISRRQGQVFREVKTAVSPDFVHWSEPELLECPGVPEAQLYTNQITPYPRAPHIFVGFPARYLDPGGSQSVWRDLHNHLPEIDHRKKRFRSSRRAGTALTESLFMTSRDGRTFKRWREAFLRPGPANWAYADNFIAWQLVETASVFPGAPNELSLYASEASWIGKPSRMRRYTLRLDGFVSVHAGADEAEMVTRPFIFSGKALEINFATSAAGSLRVGFLDAAGVPVPGFALRDCQVIVGDSVARTVSWDGGTDLSKQSGKPVRLRFVLADADLYAMRFLPEAPQVAFTPRFQAQDKVAQYLKVCSERTAAHRVLWEKVKKIAQKENRKLDSKAINKIVNQDPNYAAIRRREIDLQHELQRSSVVVPGYTQAANTMVNEQIRLILAAGKNGQSGKLTPKALTDALIESFKQLPDEWPFTRPMYREGVSNNLKALAGNVVAVPRLSRPPTIDGRASKEEWAAALELSALRLSQYLNKPERSKKLADAANDRYTTARMGYDDKALYVCWACRELRRRDGKPGLGVTVDLDRKRDGAVWRDDAVGIVLQSALADRESYRLTWNAEGVCYDALGIDADWNGKQEAAVGKDEKANQWTVEMALPWSDLDLEPASGDVLRCNLSRYQIGFESKFWWRDLKISAWTVLPFGIDDPPPHDLPLGVLILE